MSSSPSVASRRHMLKSGLLLAVGAGLPVAGMGSQGAVRAPQWVQVDYLKAWSHSCSPMSSFRCPSWFAWELRQKAPDSISWLRAIISNLGRRTSVTPGRPG